MVHARTNITAMRLSVFGVKLWNSSLSNNLRDCNSVVIFKNNLKKCVISITVLVYSANIPGFNYVCNFAITLQVQYHYDC